jgi:hypothetical protein
MKGVEKQRHGEFATKLTRDLGSAIAGIRLLVTPETVLPSSPFRLFDFFRGVRIDV